MPIPPRSTESIARGRKVPEGYRLDSGRKFEYVRPAGAPAIYQAGTNITVSADERIIMLPLADRRESDLMLVENFQ